MTSPLVVRRLNRLVVIGLWGVLGISLLGAAALAVPGFASAYGPVLNQIAYPVASLGAAVLLVAMAWRFRGRERWAWSTIGLGVACWAIGECIWQAYLLAGLEVPYPGAADLFYVAGYPVLAAGVLLLPHVRPGKYERIRLVLDSVVGTVAISILMWIAYLNRVIVIDGAAPFLENFINAFYGAGDVILLITVMVLALRRSDRRFDLRLLFLGAALAVTAFADVAYYVQVDAGVYSEGSWLDSLWLGSYALFTIVALRLSMPSHLAEEPPDSVSWLRLAAPYGAAGSLFVFSLFQVDGSDALLNWATTMVGGLIILRQGVAIRENRELVERQRDDLVASVSHELRTPLTAIQGYAQLLGDDWQYLDDAQRKETIGVVTKQAKHLGRIVTDLVETARDRLAAVELDRQDLAPTVVMQQAVEALSPASRDQVSITADAGLVVHADRERLVQILVNLLTNAVRYGRGEILLAARGDLSAVRFEVHDNGSGIPKKYEAAIWERFERGAHRYDSTTPGSGIGLPIARALVEAHGGVIQHRRSEALGGACFAFTIPAASVHAGTARRAPYPPPLIRVASPLRAAATRPGSSADRAPLGAGRKDLPDAEPRTA